MAEVVEKVDGVVMLVASFVMLLALNGLQSWAAKRR